MKSGIDSFTDEAAISLLLSKHGAWYDCLSLRKDQIRFGHDGASKYI